MTEATAPRRREREDGRRSRQRILDTAARLASVEGLEGLSIGRLAAATGMSKSGLYAHFGTKQELQLATIDAARQIFITVVVQPALSNPRGVGRLRALCARFLDHVDQQVFPGGCFFVAVGVEMSGRTGAVRDRIAQEQQDWISLIEHLVRESVETGDLSDDTDVTQLAFELNASVIAANAAYVLHADRTALQRAQVAIDERLARAAG